MLRCPGCAQNVSTHATRCAECNTFLGSPRDLGTLAIAMGSVLGIVTLLVLSNIVFPNLALSRAIDGVRSGDRPGMDKLRTGFERREVSITGAPSLGWDAEKFGDIVLVSFNYLSLVEETPKRYAAWWAFETSEGKTTVIQNAQEFIEGFLLRRGLANQFPKGLVAPAAKGKI